MNVAASGSREAAPARESSDGNRAAAANAEHVNRARGRGTASTVQHRYATDDEILGIGSAASPTSLAGSGSGSESQEGSGEVRSEPANGDTGANARPPGAEAAQANDPHLQAALDAHPELRQAWQDAQSYREVFATPEEARAATALVGDLNRIDALFFSRRAADHAELARLIAELDPAASASLAQALNNVSASAPQPAAANGQVTAAGEKQQQVPRTPSRGPENQGNAETAGASPAQLEFLHATNAAAVQGVIDAIETQVDRLLPDGVSKAARNRVVGEIYRELDAMLGSNRQLGQQLRDAIRSGNLDPTHQRAVVSLVAGRARQALPAVAKRVLNEWTSTVLAANQDRLSRQRAAAHRVDIAGSGRGGDAGRRSLGPRDIDYARLSDSDILNL